jgi:ech hydrogenase subunit A
MVKAGSYLVLRLAPAFSGDRVLGVVTLVGAFTFSVTALLAIGQSNSKRVLAYSTISNLGLIVACAGLNTPLAYGAAMMILCFHAVSKALLFLCVGTVEQRIGSRDIEDMGDLMFRMPVTATFALLGMLSMLVPPFGMLISKWMAIEAAVREPVPLLLIIAGSAFTILFWAKWIGRLQTVSYHREYTAEQMRPSMLIALFILAVCVVVAGCTAVPLYQYVLEPVCRTAFAGRHVAADEWSLMDSANRLLLWPAFALLGGALLLAFFRGARINESHIRMPFMCGENTESEVSVEETGVPSYTFVGPADRTVKAWVGAFYLRGVFSEERLTPWVNFLAGMLLLGLLGRMGTH